MRDHVNGLAQGSSLNACVSPQSWWCFTWRFSRDHVLNATRNGTILLDHITSFIQSASKRTPNCRMVYVCSAQRWLFLFSWAQNALIYFCSNMFCCRQNALVYFQHKIKSHTQMPWVIFVLFSVKSIVLCLFYSGQNVLVYSCSGQHKRNDHSKMHWGFLFSSVQNVLVYFCSGRHKRNSQCKIIIIFFVLTRTKNITFSFCTERFNYRLKFVLVGTNLYRRNKSIKSIKSFPSKRKSENFRSGQNKTNLFIWLRMSFVLTRTKINQHISRRGNLKKTMHFIM